MRGPKNRKSLCRLFRFRLILHFLCSISGPRERLDSVRMLRFIPFAKSATKTRIKRFLNKKEETGKKRNRKDFFARTEKNVSNVEGFFIIESGNKHKNLNIPSTPHLNGYWFNAECWEAEGSSELKWKRLFPFFCAAWDFLMGWKVNIL